MSPADPPAPEGPWAGILAALALVLGALGELLRRRFRNGRNGNGAAPRPSQLDRIEKRVETLEKALVVSDADGYPRSANVKLADRVVLEICSKLEPRLARIERRLARRLEEKDDRTE